MQYIELDGAHGEGGGQILRTALTLAMITGRPFRIANIRARRAKPGLLRQHLTAVLAAAEICGAEIEGAAPGAQTLLFKPGKIKGGAYRYAIGTAGSCTLVLQTLLPALWFADGPSSVTVTGGTHNPAAPSADFLRRAWLPIMRRMGVEMDIELLRHGFYPAGGGEVCTRIVPVKTLHPLDLTERGAPLDAKAVAMVAGVPGDVAKRELERIVARLGPIATEIRGLPAREGPGNALMVALEYEHCCAVFTEFGAKGLPAEAVADRLAKQVRHYRAGTAAVDEHLADQLALPMALAGSSRLTALHESSHLRTNLQIIGKFLPVDIRQWNAEGTHWLEIGKQEQ